MRKNREAILEAARELFADSADVAMCRVARRAGVGQATLYRNFPDRSALAAEILSEQIERIREDFDLYEGAPDAFFVLLRDLIDTMVEFQLLGDLVRVLPPEDPRLRSERSRIVELIKPSLHDSKVAGSLSWNTSVEDVFLLLSMARGAIEGAGSSTARSAAASRTLALMIGGLRASDGGA